MQSHCKPNEEQESLRFPGFVMPVEYDYIVATWLHETFVMLPTITQNLTFNCKYVVFSFRPHAKFPKQLQQQNQNDFLSTNNPGFLN